jgi:S1-C subfamily serine protease
LVQTTSRGGPAAEAGIRGGDRVAQAGMRRFYVGGDVLTAIDGQKIASRVDVDLMLNKKRPGDDVTVTLFRGGKKMDVKVKLGERPMN